MTNTEETIVLELLAGPFKVTPDTDSEHQVSQRQISCRQEIAFIPKQTEAERRIDCSNYQECLNLAATFNWDSFTCAGCSGSVNKSLRWRAGQTAKRDELARALCGADTLASLKSSATNSVAPVLDDTPSADEL